MKKETVIPSIAMSILIIALISLMFLPPVVAKNKFVKHIENGEYIFAGGVLETNQENPRIKKDAENIIKVLDADIEKVLADLYKEEVDLANAEALANLYTKLASLSSLPTENGDTLLQTVDMYEELNNVKGYINEKSYEELGKELISTKYADVEVYAEVLSRSINESNKNEIVKGLDSGINHHISRAKGNYSFASVPNLLDGETVLAKLLLNNTEYNQLVNKINEYNSACACATNGCINWAKNTYCEAHKCEDDDCQNMKKGEYDYCAKHICAAPGCDNYRGDDTYCYSHECSEDGCKKYASNGNYCSAHTKKSYSPSSSSSSGSFTNKYGSRTTKCVVSGCSNNIASSGDTNCCTKHSNRCGNCNCYIDGDAMFCMSCLVSALG